jgi:chloramphenicol-sensitive protein RarD
MVRIQGSLPQVREALSSRRTRVLLGIASLLVGSNWGLFIWSTMNGHVLDASLGYYFVPLFSTALGVFVFGERLRRLQWFALTLAACGVIYVTWENGSIPWVGLGLSTTWAVYGFVKKSANVDAIESLVVETSILAPFAISYLGLIETTGTGTFLRGGTTHALLLAGAGLITSVPLLLYGAAVVRAPLTSIGFMQYISSTIQFLTGVFLFHEHMDMARLTGFAITWLALIVLTADGVRSRRGLPEQAIAEPD